MENRINTIDYFSVMAKDLDAFNEKAWNKKEGYKTPSFPSITNGLEGWDSGLYIFAGAANHGEQAIEYK